MLGVATEVSLFALLAVGLFTANEDRRHVVMGRALAAVAALLAVLATWLPTRGLVVAGLLAAFGFGAFLTLGLLHRVLQRQERVTADVLYSAITVFLLAAVDWAILYLAVEMLLPGSLKGALEPPVPLALNFSDCLYFSVTVLTTTGFGDIAPLTRPARLLASLEELFGIIYPAVILARLVGLYTRSEAADEASHDAALG